MLKLLIISAVMAAIIQRGIKYWFFMHYNKSGILYHHAPGPCVHLEGAGQESEDLTILPNGLVFISSGLLEGQGRVLLFDFADPTHAIKALQITGASFNQSEFVPHGLSAWVNNHTGEITLMVLNHAPREDQVEVFKFQEKTKTLLHVKSIVDRMFRRMNDLVLTSENTFYITKMFASMDQIRRKWELNLLIKFGEILYFDGTKAKSVARDLFLPNGINRSPDGKYIYLAEFGTNSLKSYKRNNRDELEIVQSLYLDSGLDNVEVEPKSGDLWIGSHPLIYRIIEHNASKGKDGPSPSQVFKVKVEDGKFIDTTEVYLNNGTELSASTVASVYKGRMIVGSLSSSPMICDLKCSG